MSFLLLPCRRFVTRRVFSTVSKRAVETDSCAIPLRPTWSVNALLSSYPVPSLAPRTLNRLHELSALIPPAENSPGYEELKTGLEELVRLVEAVKLVNTEGFTASESADSVGHTARNSESEELSHDGRSLLRHAARTRDGFYLVDADKPQ